MSSFKCVSVLNMRLVAIMVAIMAIKGSDYSRVPNM